MTHFPAIAASRHTRRPARGLTLIELLVVMVILTLITVATIPLLQPATGARKVREAARLVATTFEGARARAVETGRPAGVWIQRLPGPTSLPPNFPPNARLPIEARTMFFCEVPPPYCGDSLNATVTISQSLVTFDQTLSPSLLKLVKYGDLIRFNYKGPYYQLVGGQTGELLKDNKPFINISPGQSFPPSTVGNTGVPFQILRQPVKSAFAPVNLTGNAPFPVIDMVSSGMGQDTEFELMNPSESLPLIVTFAPTGRVDRVMYSAGTFAKPSFEILQPTSPIYFLVVLRREEPLYPGANYKDAEAMWVAINPSTGLVTVTETAMADTGNPPNPPNDIFQARKYARGVKQIGGN